jgi:multicomponent Na+:H+ antiporter subunit D
MTAATTGMVCVTVALTVFAGPIYDVCARAGASIMQPVQLNQLTGEVGQ